MGIEIVLLPEELQNRDISNSLVVIIDVLRASSTIVTALAENAVRVIPVFSPAEARKRAATLCLENVLLCGERGGQKLSDFDLGNSPREYISSQVKDKVVLLSTTNGVRAINMTNKAKQIIIGCFLNILAVVQYCQYSSNNVLLVCAGDRGNISLEDTVCAGMIKYLIGGNDCNQSSNYLSSNDDAQIALLLYQQFKDNLREMLQTSIWGQQLIAMGFKRDLIFCAQTNVYNVIPVLKEDNLIIAEHRDKI
jgi:2-phosphosulfolactate phosphatase